MSNKNITQLPEWIALSKHRDAMDGVQIKGLFADDSARFEHFHLKLANQGLLFDYSKHRANAETIALLCALARAQHVEKMRDQMLGGVAINRSEDRAVLHMALRGSTAKDLVVDGENVTDFVNDTLARIKSLSDKIRNNLKITDVINIGIGGSDLGPRMVCQALRPYANGPRMHFVANMDGCALDEVLRKCDPQHTFVIITSKTFTTLETLTNARSVKSWLAGALAPEALAEHFCAVTTNKDAALDFGMPHEHILPVRDWIGGRFSVWGAVGLPIAVACGFSVFQDFLKGARQMDRHFIEAPLEHNMPALMGMLGIWYRNFWRASAQAVLPYAHDLVEFPRYLQQVDMESNGKSVDQAGNPVQNATGSLIFGEPGTNAQHDFMQLFHQGTDVIPADFITFRQTSHRLPEQHNHLFSHALAQSKALMDGAAHKEPYRHFPGNRPSSTLLLERLDAKHLGMLMALYEHKVFVQGVIWGINSFDQWGVELGKIIAKDVYGAMIEPKSSPERFDSSTAGLLDVFQG